MGDPVFVRRDGGAGIFRVDDGSEVRVSLADSPFASQLAASAALMPQPAAQPPRERAPVVIDEPFVVPMPERQPPPPRDWIDDVRPYDRADVKLDEPVVVTRPGHTADPAAVEAAMHPPPPVAVPPMALAGQTPWQSGDNPFVIGGAPDPSRPMPAGGVPAAPQAPAAASPFAPGQTPENPFVYGPQPTRTPPRPGQPSQQPQGGPRVIDATGGASAQPRGGMRRAGGGSGGGAPQQPAPPSLDSMMVPDGVAGPGLYGAMVDDMAGGPRGLREQQRLGQWGNDIEAQRAEVQQQYADDARAAHDAGEQRRMELERERQQAMGAARQRYDNALRRVQSMQIDPSRFFRSGSGFGTVGAALAVGLGAIGATIAGRDGNDVLPIIQRAIDNDIDSQRANLANAQSGLDGEMNLLREMGSEFQSREAAEQATRAAMLQQAEMRANALLAGVASEEVQQRGQALAGQLRDQYNAAAAAAVRAEEDHEMQRALQASQLRMRNARAAREERRGMGGGAARPVAPTTGIMDAFNRMVDSGADPQAAAATLRLDPSVIPPAGRFNEPTNTDQTGTVAALSSALDGLESRLPPEGEDIPGIGATGWTPDFMTSEAGLAIRQQVAAVEELIGRLHSGGAITADEVTLYRGILGSNRDERLRQGIQMIRAELASRANRRIQGNTRGQQVDQQARGLREVTE